MNKLLFICILSIASFSLQAQSLKPADVPATVTSVFKYNYPNATNAKWEMEDGMYEVTFQNAKKEMSVLYSNKGQLAMTETACEVSELPAGVMEYVTKNMAGAKITEATKQVDAMGNVSYEAKVNNADYLFSATGQFMLKQVDEDGDND